MPRPPVVVPGSSSEELAALTPRTAKLLLGQGLTTSQQIIECYPEGLLAIRGFGFKSLREIEHCFLPGRYYNPK